MTFDLRQLEQDYSDRSVEFVGVFPNASTTPAQIASFKETYGLSMTMIQDTAGWAETLGAKWTPEVFVLDQRDSVVYQGRIQRPLFRPWQAQTQNQAP